MRIEKELRVYTTQNSKMPFNQWLSQIKDKTVRAKIKKRLDRLSLGHYGDVKPVGEGVFELRFQFGPGYRIYFAEINKIIIILLCGGDKSTQYKDINKATQYWKELNEREEYEIFAATPPYIKTYN